MAELVANCPRCGSRQITFDVTQHHVIRVEYGWQYWYEAFSICRHCKRAAIFVLCDSVDADHEYFHKQGLLNVHTALNNYVRNEGYINVKDVVTVQPPEHLPQNIEKVFREGATCLAVGCNNGAGTMFRLCIDLATKGMLPENDEQGLNKRIRRDLGLRLPWLLDHQLLPESLRELSKCVREDGNDGAHQGTLIKEDAEDLLDFTRMLLERVYTEPKRLELAEERRKKRRGDPSDG